MFTDISKFCTPHSVAWVLSCATHTQHARNMACCAATQRGNLRCFALLPRIFGTASLLNGVLPFLRPVSGRSAKHRKLQRCVAAQHAMLRACCVCVAHDKTHATLQIVDKLLPHSKWPAKPPNYCEFHRQPKNRAKKSKRSVDNFFLLAAKHQKLLQALSTALLLTEKLSITRLWDFRSNPQGTPKCDPNTMSSH